MRPIHNTTNSFSSRRRLSASDLLGSSLLLLLLMVAGCTPEEDERALPKGAISFTSEAKTKGDSFEKDSTMGIYSYYASNGEFFMENQQVTCQGGNSWTYSPTRYWPGSTLTFYAYSPYNLNNPIPTKENGIPYLSYTVPSDASTDLLISTGEINVNTVNFPFRHALTRVRIESTASDKVVTKVEFSGIALSGTTSLAAQETIIWALNEQTGTVSKELKEEEQTLTNGQLIAEFYMLPQKMPEDAKCIVTTGDGKTETFSLSSRAWEVGKIARYTYPVDDGAVLDQDEDEYYLIDDADDLKLFLDKYVGNSIYEGSYYKLTGNISVAADDIKDLVGKDFLGYLDGGGNAIEVTGTLDRGLFGTIGNDSETDPSSIADLAFEATIVNFKDEYIGGISAINHGTVGNCIFRGSITAGAGAIVGGISGRCYVAGGPIDNCENYGTIKTMDNSTVGGVFGIVDRRLTNIKNYGKIEGGNNSYIGGICGIFEGTGLNGCSNENAIIGKDNAIVGGICGKNSFGYIMNCTNKNTIYGGENSYVGGIIGENYAYCGCDEDGLEFGPCSNSGTISGGDDSHVGGICGNSTGDILNCTNTGKVTATGSNDKTYLGGICGYLTEPGSIAACQNSGDISINESSLQDPRSNMGEICGYNMKGTIELSSCTINGRRLVNGEVVGVADESDLDADTLKERKSIGTNQVGDVPPPPPPHQG